MTPYNKIFVIGMPRTGTMSATAALQRLGHNVHHGPTVEEGGDWSIWEHFWRGDFRPGALDDFDGWADSPIWVYWRQLYDAWPGSRFILTTRPIDDWLRSAGYMWRDRSADRVAYIGRLFTSGACFGLMEWHEGRARWLWERHHHMVKYFFQERMEELLVLDLVAEDRWEKLCNFLGHDEIPDESYPWTNMGEQRGGQ